MTTDPSEKEKTPVPYKKWLNQDVAYIISQEERSAFLKLATDVERENFIETFWKRRDPTPGTEENEYKEEHYRRIAYANEHFSTGIPGWKTDMGRVYVVYGPPDVISTAGAAFAWTYRYIDGVGENVTVVFENSRGDGEYRLTKDSALKMN
jgi:GWxTD domain-containing protein